MSLAFVMDQHVPAAITAGLRRRGIDVRTALDVSADRVADPVLLETATTLDRVLFSQDEDLLAVAHEWQTQGRDFAGLVYAHQLHVSIGRVVRDLELMAALMEPAEMRNRVQFLPL